jgi:hypothetical protein
VGAWLFNPLLLKCSSVFNADAFMSQECTFTLRPGPVAGLPKGAKNSKEKRVVVSVLTQFYYAAPNGRFLSEVAVHGNNQTVFTVGKCRDFRVRPASRFRTISYVDCRLHQLHDACGQRLSY